MDHNQDGFQYLVQSWPVETYPTWEDIMNDWRFLSGIIFPPQEHPGFARQPGWPSAPHLAQSHITYIPHSLGLGVSRPYPRSLRRHFYNHHLRTLPLSTPRPPSRRPIQRPKPSYKPVTLSPVHLARKPREWRSGYKSSSKGGLGRYFSRIIPRVPRNTLRRSHLALYSIISHPTSFSYDLRNLPTSPYGSSLSFQSHPLNGIDLNQPASSPPTLRLVLWHRKLPWYIKIEASHPSGITIQDVFTGIYNGLQLPIGHHEYYTAELTSQDRDMLNVAFQKRCRGNRKKIRGGVLRMDFLGQETCFSGISHSGNGAWELKTVPYVVPRMMLD